MCANNFHGRQKSGIGAVLWFIVFFVKELLWWRWHPKDPRIVQNPMTTKTSACWTSCSTNSDVKNAFSTREWAWFRLPQWSRLRVQDGCHRMVQMGTSSQDISPQDDTKVPQQLKGTFLAAIWTVHCVRTLFIMLHHTCSSRKKKKTKTKRTKQTRKSPVFTPTQGVRVVDEVKRLAFSFWQAVTVWVNFWKNDTRVKSKSFDTKGIYSTSR